MMYNIRMKYLILILLFSCSVFKSQKVLSPIENLSLQVGTQLIQVEAKVDTGAKLATIDARNIVKVNANLVEFDYTNRITEKKITLRAKIKNLAYVRNSSGKVSKRFTIEALITLKGETYPIEITLFNRSTMNYPMILGRDSLNGFLVDPSAK
jgi:hypothetical protein